jgi:putative endonuclease
MFEAERYSGVVAYIMASGRNGTLYTGVTSDILLRVWQHKSGIRPGFSSKYGCKTLVWYELCDGMVDAIRREKQIKKWPRVWKLRIIDEANPEWRDLSDGWYAENNWDFQGREGR